MYRCVPMPFLFVPLFRVNRFALVLPVSESDVYSSVSSSFLSSFHCFVSDISLLDSCALHMTGVTFYFYTGGCAAAACRPKIKAHLNYQSSKKNFFL